MSTAPRPPSGYALGIDFGTSHTVAVGRWPDGRARPLLVDGSPLLPSAVYAEPSGQLVVGRDAVHCARRDPARFEPNPKRRVDDGTVLLGERELPVVELIAAVLARIGEEWRRAAGPVPTAVTLTCPATWGATRRTLLADAAAAAGFTGARLVAEPVAAATYFAQVLGRDVPIGSVVVVHDFGAGTFDATVVARTGSGFEVLAVDGRDDVGGLDVDAAVIDHLRLAYADRDPAAWERLDAPATVEDRRAHRQLWDDARVAKERLSRAQSADVMIPLLDLEVHLTRDELEGLARPVLIQTVQVTGAVMRAVDIAPGRLAGLFLVGGGSRIPLVATLLHQTLGEAPVVIEQPELVVAEGSLLAEAALLTAEPAAPGVTGEMRALARRPPAGADASGPSRMTTRHTGSAPVSPPAPPPAAAPLDQEARREQALRDQARREQALRDQARQEQARRERAARERAVRERAVREQAARERAAREQAAREQPGPQAPRPAPPAAPARPAQGPRRGRFGRFAGALFIVLLLVTLPVLAAVFAYGIGNAQPPMQDARDLLQEILRFVGMTDRFQLPAGPGSVR
jgi:pyruvate/2-oxoglutarate dehydrogenase complex dihydrolipoamide acyltransferase (E2) component